MSVYATVLLFVWALEVLGSEGLNRIKRRQELSKNFIIFLVSFVVNGIQWTGCGETNENFHKHELLQKLLSIPAVICSCITLEE